MAPELTNTDRFLNHISKLRNEEWSPGDPLPDFLSNEIEPEHQIDFSTDLALLPHLYGDKFDNLAFSLLEAYLWSKAGKSELRKLGWLEGNIVLVDFFDGSVTIPQADNPAGTLSPPFLWGNQDDETAEFRKVLIRLDAPSPTLRELIKSSRILNPAFGKLLNRGLENYERRNEWLHELLRGDVESRQFRDSDDIQKRLYQPVLKHSGELAKRLKIDGKTIREQDWTAILEKTLTDRLLHMLVTEQISQRRTDTDAKKKDEFVEAFQSRERRSKLEDEMSIFFVDDAQMSMLCLEYCIGLKSPQIAGRTIEAAPDKDDLYTALGLFDEKKQISARGENVVDWLKQWVAWEAKKDTANPDYRAIRANWGDSPLVNEGVVHRLAQHLGEFDAAPGPKKFKEIIGSVFQRGCRSRNDIEGDHLINLGIHLFLRYQETIPRHMLAFPFTHTGKGTEKQKRLAAYFLGTITDLPNSLGQDRALAASYRRKQIGDLKLFIERTFTYATFGQHLQQSVTLTRDLQKAADEARLAAEDARRSREMLNQASFVFGHETKNRADEIDSRTQILNIEAILKSGDLPEHHRATLRRMIEAFSQIEDLYGISELLGQLDKLINFGLPEKWIDPAMTEVAKRWPAAFDEDPARFLEPLAQSCRKSILTSIGPYVAKAEREGIQLVIREITPEGPVVCQPVNFLSLTESVDALQIPPLAGYAKNRAPNIALLAGMTEHIRNALRYMRKNSKRILELARVVHLDFRIRAFHQGGEAAPSPERTNSVEVGLWNPITPDGIADSPTVLTMRDIYRAIGTRRKSEASNGGPSGELAGVVEIVPAVVIDDYEYATAPDYRDYACSRIAFKPERFWFSTQNQDRESSL